MNSDDVIGSGLGGPNRRSTGDNPSCDDSASIILAGQIITLIMPGITMSLDESVEIIDQLVKEIVNNVESAFTLNQALAMELAQTTVDDELRLTVKTSEPAKESTAPVTEERNIKWLAGMARTFRTSIDCKTILAFGSKHQLVFTGRQAIDHFASILQRSATHSHSRQETISLLQVLVDDLWLFVPCGVQQKKGWTLETGSKLSDTQSHLSRSSITIFDDDRNLYRLTKDALALDDMSAECFDEFVQWFANEQCGIRRWEGRLGMFKRVAAQDGYFSLYFCNSWLESYLGAFSAAEKDAIRKMLIVRNIIDKVFMHPSYFKFRDFVLQKQR